MYGTIFHMQVKPGQLDRLKELTQEWERDLKPHIDGVVGNLLLHPDAKADELVGVAVFRDRESYRAYLNNPQQDERLRKMRECLEADPEWEDGEYLEVTGFGESLAQAA